MTAAGMSAVLIVEIGALIVMALLAGCSIAAALYRKPRASLTVWLIVATCMPYWIGTNGSGYIPALSLLGVALLLMLNRISDIRVHAADWLMAGVISFGAVAVMAGGASQGAWLIMVTHWAVAYLVGKTLAAQVAPAFLLRVFSITFGLVGGLAIVEFLLKWHPFTGIAMDNNAYRTWARIQDRGGLDRSEWAFGHSLSLGGALCLAIPFVISSNLRRRWKFLLLAMIAGGVLCTFSRAAMITAAFTFVISVLFTSKLGGGKKFGMFLALTGRAFAAISMLAPVFETAGFEAESSGDYRRNFVTELIDELSPVGQSESAQYFNNAVLFGGYNSIDNALLGVALSFGWVVAAFPIIGLLAMVSRLFHGRANVVEVALLGQIPMLMSVGFITQYQTVVWFLAGCAVAMATRPGQAEPALPNLPDGERPSHFVPKGAVLVKRYGVKVPARGGQYPGSPARP